ncbi:MAG: SGNH/GDSL hydrolase family protein [Verrucomicrobiia bacterium]
MNSSPTPVRTDHSISWFDLRQLGVEGRGWKDTKVFYDRLPAKAEGVVRPEVWDLSRHSAGMHVRFVTNATVIRARWALKLPALNLPNMAATAVSGLDLYVRTDGGQWHWLAVGIPEAQTNSVTLVENLAPGQREYLLYLPIYNAPEFVELGVPQDAPLEPAGPWGPGERKPMVFYGTSIVHGLCASRPGMTHSAILGRKFDYPIINLGFSGNGKMEPEMAGLLAELDPSVYVLDCLPNLVDSEVRERAEPFVRRLRAAHPKTPIVLVEDRPMQDGFLVTIRSPHHRAVRAELKAAHDRLTKSGLHDLHSIPGEHLLGDDGEGSVDASHPTDLGFMRQAEIFAQTLGPLLRAR